MKKTEIKKSLAAPRFETVWNLSGVYAQVDEGYNEWRHWSQA